MISSTGHLKVVDFGFAKVLTDRTYSVCGTPEFLSPEVIMRQGHDKRVDWWSFGVLLWELVIGMPAFCSDSPMKIYEKIMNHTRFFFPPTRVCQELRDVINGCVVRDPDGRLNGSQLRQMPFFADIDWEMAMNAQLESPWIPQIENEVDTRYFEEYPELTKENEGSTFDNSMFADF